jgi:hypothetical protein
MYTKKREWLRRLSIANEAKVKEWNGMDRRPSVNKNGEVRSVFYNSSTKGKNTIYHILLTNLRFSGISFESVYQRLLKTDVDTTGLPVSQTIYFLAEGLAIESKQ